MLLAAISPFAPSDSAGPAGAGSIIRCHWQCGLLEAVRSPGRRSAWAGVRGGLTRTVTGTVGIIVPCGLAYVHGALRDSDPSRGNLKPSVMVHC